MLESLDFEYSEGTKWWAILGGAQQLVLKMEKTLKYKPTYQSRVTAIRVAMKPTMMEVDIKSLKSENTKPEKRTYNGVFNTTTLGYLKRIDIRKSNLNYTTLQATRSLGYGPAAKVGIKFKHT